MTWTSFEGRPYRQWAERGNLKATVAYLGDAWYWDVARLQRPFEPIAKGEIKVNGDVGKIKAIAEAEAALLEACKAAP